MDQLSAILAQALDSLAQKKGTRVSVKMHEFFGAKQKRPSVKSCVICSGRGKEMR